VPERDRLKKLATLSIASIALIAGGTTYAFASTGDADDPTSGNVPLTGATLQRASEAARDATGGATVLSADEGNEGNEGNVAYELDVKTSDGQRIDVQLDKAFHVTAQETDTPDKGRSKD
jgi:uncharacterized membrane protein YkoI